MFLIGDVFGFLYVIQIDLINKIGSISTLYVYVLRASRKNERDFFFSKKSISFSFQLITKYFSILFAHLINNKINKSIVAFPPGFFLFLFFVCFEITKLPKQFIVFCFQKSKYRLWDCYNNNTNTAAAISTQIITTVYNLHNLSIFIISGC